MEFNKEGYIKDCIINGINEVIYGIKSSIEIILLSGGFLLGCNNIDYKKNDNLETQEKQIYLNEERKEFLIDSLSFDDFQRNIDKLYELEDQLDYRHGEKHDLDKSIEIANQLLKIYKLLEDNYNIGRMHRVIGKSYFYQKKLYDANSEFDKSIKNFNKFLHNNKENLTKKELINLEIRYIADLKKKRGELEEEIAVIIHGGKSIKNYENSILYYNEANIIYSKIKNELIDKKRQILKNYNIDIEEYNKSKKTIPLNNENNNEKQGKYKSDDIYGQLENIDGQLNKINLLQCQIYINLGEIYYNFDDIDRALNYSNKSFETLGVEENGEYIINSEYKEHLKGIIYNNKAKYKLKNMNKENSDSIYNNIKKSLELLDDGIYALGEQYYLLGNYYNKKNNIDKSIKNYIKSILNSLDKESKEKFNGKISELCSEFNVECDSIVNKEGDLEILDKSLKELNNIINYLTEVNEGIETNEKGDIDIKNNMGTKIQSYFKIIKIIKSSNEDIIVDLMEKDLKYVSDSILKEMSNYVDNRIIRERESEYIAKKEYRSRIEEQDKKIRKQEIEKQKAELWSIILLLISIGAGSFVIVGIFINKKIRNQKNEINNLLKNKNDSIQAAKKLQNSLLERSQENIENNFPASFILYKPRDIVSGDFYWSRNINNKKVVAVCDATGHGVPGAITSVVGLEGLSKLEESIKNSGELKADKVINDLSNHYIESYYNSNKEEEHKVTDGADGVLAIIDEKNKKINFSGGYNPLVHFSNGEIKSYKTDRRSIGYHPRNIKFQEKEISYKPGDIIYMFSDGYEDQFGGKQNKKFLKTRFINLLRKKSIRNYHDMEQIKYDLEEEITDWIKKGKYGEQIDDITVVGIKLQ